MKANAVPRRQGRELAQMRIGLGSSPHEVRWTDTPCVTRNYVKRHLLIMVVFGWFGCTREDTKPVAAVPDAGARAKLISVGPRLLSNQTSQPLSVVAEKLEVGQKLELGAPVSRAIDLVIIDERHAYGRLPPGLGAGSFPEVVVEARLTGHDGVAELRLINDINFPDVSAFVLSGDGRRAFAASVTTDQILVLELASGTVTPFAVSDGPTALGVWKEGQTEWLVVAHQYSNELLLVQTADTSVRRTVTVGTNAAGLVIAQDRAFVAEQARDTVAAFDLKAGKEVWRTSVAPNPRELAIAGKRLAVGSLETGAIEWLSLETGEVEELVEPGPKTPIVGGGTAAFAQYVMNGKAPRGLAWSSRSSTLFVSSIGPNIGPNPEKMEVSMNAGVGVVDGKKGWRRHLGFGAGVTEGLALDDARGLLYVGDVGLGLVRVLEVKKLAGSDGDAARAQLQELALRPPAGFPSIRPAEDFNVKGRAGPSLHAGPRFVALTPDAKTLVVLERFTCTVALIDVSKPGKAEWKQQHTLCDALTQPSRRLGQVLYHADLGRTAMSCDACHVDGHNEGVLFEKTMPLRIYRSTTVRGSRETPPYFTPASTRSMGETMKVVGGRNRFHNPAPSPTEIEALTLYGSLIPTLPNPFVGADGAPLEALTLPDGKVGHPRKGLLLFEGRAACSSCHPAPQFTTDQDPATRGRFIDVGTPHFMPLREKMQNTRFEGFGTPALVGSWDVFPLFTTGLAGLEVKEDGAVKVKTRFPLRPAIEDFAPKHGRADLLTAEEKDDLLAYVLSL
jgi:hypothetical protein